MNSSDAFLHPFLISYAFSITHMKVMQISHEFCIISVQTTCKHCIQKVSIGNYIQDKYHHEDTNKQTSTVTFTACVSEENYAVEIKRPQWTPRDATKSAQSTGYTVATT